MLSRRPGVRDNLDVDRDRGAAGPLTALPPANGAAACSRCWRRSRGRLSQRHYGDVWLITGEPETTGRSFHVADNSGGKLELRKSMDDLTFDEFANFVRDHWRVSDRK